MLAEDRIPRFVSHAARHGLIANHWPGGASRCRPATPKPAAGTGEWLLPADSVEQLFLRAVTILPANEHATDNWRRSERSANPQLLWRQIIENRHRLGSFKSQAA
jgi:hypothetical protein